MANDTNSVLYQFSVIKSRVFVGIMCCMQSCDKVDVMCCIQSGDKEQRVCGHNVLYAEW